MSHTFATRKKMDGLSVFTLRNGRQTMDLDKDKILAKVNKLLSRIESIEQKNAELEDKIEDLEEENTNLKERIAELELFVEEKSEKIEDLDTTVSELDKSVYEMESTLKDVYDRTANYNLGYTLYEDTSNSKVYGVSLFDLVKLVNPDLLIETSSTVTSWKEISATEDVKTTVKETMYKNMKNAEGEIFDMNWKVKDCYDRTRNYNNGMVLFGDGEGNVDGIHLGHLARGVADYTLAKNITNTSNWFRITEEDLPQIKLAIYNTKDNYNANTIQAQIDGKLDKVLSEPIIIDWLNAAGTPYDVDHAELTDVVEILQRLADDIKYGSQHIEKNAGYIHNLIQDKTEINNTLVELDSQLDSRTAAISEHIDEIESQVQNLKIKSSNYNNGVLLFGSVGTYKGYNLNNIISTEFPQYCVTVPPEAYDKYGDSDEKPMGSAWENCDDPDALRTYITYNGNNPYVES